MTCEPLDEAVIIAECANREAREAAEKAEAMRKWAAELALSVPTANNRPGGWRVLADEIVEYIKAS